MGKGQPPRQKKNLPSGFRGPSNGSWDPEEACLGSPGVTFGPAHTAPLQAPNWDKTGPDRTGRAPATGTETGCDQHRSSGEVSTSRSGSLAARKGLGPRERPSPGSSFAPECALSARVGCPRARIGRIGLDRPKTMSLGMVRRTRPGEHDECVVDDFPESDSYFEDEH